MKCLTGGGVLIKGGHYRVSCYCGHMFELLNPGGLSGARENLEPKAAQSKRVHLRLMFVEFVPRKACRKTKASGRMTVVTLVA